MKKAKIFLCVTLAAVLLLYAGCGKQETVTEDRPWAASEGAENQKTTKAEFTRSEEMPTMEVLEVGDTTITLPMGITGADITQLEQALWSKFFYTDYDSTTADTKDAMQFVTDGAVPWGLWNLYDVLDPDHTHGEYELLSVETEPDPREQFPDEYYRADATVVDFLLEDVLHIIANHHTRAEGFYAEGESYYFQNLATGAEPTETHIRACQTLDNGHYRITAELMTAEPDSEPQHAKSAFLEVSVVRTGTLRHWSIYNVETFE